MKAGGVGGGNSGPRSDTEPMSERFERRSGDVSARLRRETPVPPPRAPTAAVCPWMSPAGGAPRTPSLAPSWPRIRPRRRARPRPTPCPVTRTGNCCSGFAVAPRPRIRPPPLPQLHTLHTIRGREGGRQRGRGTGPGPAVGRGRSRPSEGNRERAGGKRRSPLQGTAWKCPSPQSGTRGGGHKGARIGVPPRAAPRRRPHGTGGSTEPGLRGVPRYRANSARVASGTSVSGVELRCPTDPVGAPIAAWSAGAACSAGAVRVPGCVCVCVCIGVCAHTHGVRDHARAPCPARAPHPPQPPSRSGPAPHPVPARRGSPCRGNAIRAGGRRGPYNSVTRSTAPPPIHYSAAPSPRRGAVTNRAALIQLRPPPPRLGARGASHMEIACK